MASPWKLLTRLVSPRRQQRQENDPVEDVNPGVLAIAGSTEKPQPFDRTDALSAALGPSEEAGSDVHGTLEKDSAEVVEGIGAAFAYGAPKSKETVEAASAKRRCRVKTGETPVAVSQISPTARTIPDEMTSLDEEITILRGQLVSTLRLQNAQQSWLGKLEQPG